jgi:hypothetical protein
MAEKIQRPGMLRLAAAVILGGIIGTVLFLIAALGIGVINDKLGMQIPINLLIAENVFSLILFVLFLIIGIGGMCWQVWITPSSDEKTEN